MSIVSRSRLGRTALACSAALAGAVCCGALASNASALGVVVCDGSGQVTFSPALTNTLATRTITQSGTYATCVAPLNPSLHTVTIAPESETGMASCLVPLGTYSQTSTLRWNTGQTSTFTYNVTASIDDGEFVLLLTGSITAGLLNGATATNELVLESDPTACAGSGVTLSSGPAVLTVTSL